MNFSQLMSLTSGHAEARIVQIANEIGIFDAIGDKGKSADTLSRALKLDTQATELLLNALTALALVVKKGDHFSLCDVAREYLVRSSPSYVGGMIQFEASLWSCWERLPEALRTGRPVRPPNMYQEIAAETETFITAMDSLVKARGDADVLANAIDWLNVHTMLDVGSGPATYPIAFCEKFLGLRATIFDLPATLKITTRFVSSTGISDRIHLIAGDYRSEPIPGVYDLVLLSNIIHGEDCARNQALIVKLAGNLKSGGRIVIKDHILDDSRANPPVGAIFSLLMLLTTDGGRCYSYNEIKTWLEQAGLQRIQQIDLAPPLTSSLVIGTKAA